jgi:hypothetical protein
VSLVRHAQRVATGTIAETGGAELARRDWEPLTMNDDDERFADDDYVGFLAGKLARQKRRQARGYFDEDYGRESRAAGRRKRRGDRRQRESHWS